ncbi:hypothetical protein B1992_04340 [Pseudoxanthomonas broegbernensis]|uniref:Uncharacterized protein n=1 Tax=Pseudoxanthomonas broegbernensis TaxID=83619 RepID=A0A7V8GNW5_9GAMM|nr:hypothetical protein B1992_04340 [Pseudoxanthomonas broegbernensis]
MLLEALIGVLITAIMAAGMAHVASRIVSSQHDAGIDALVVGELRNVMQVAGVDLCDDPAPLADKKGLPAQLKGDISLGRQACSAATDEQLEIGGVTFTAKLPPVVELTATKGDTLVLAVSSVVPAAAGGDAP